MKGECVTKKTHFFPKISIRITSYLPYLLDKESLELGMEMKFGFINYEVFSIIIV